MQARVDNSAWAGKLGMIVSERGVPVFLLLSSRDSGSERLWHFNGGGGGEGGSEVLSEGVEDEEG